MPDEEGDPVAAVSTDPEPSARGPGGRSRNSATIVAAALAGVFFVLAVVMTFVAAKASSEQREDTGDQQEVRRVAGQLAEALLSYDYRDLGATQEAVLALATGGFSTQVREDFPALEETITELEARAVATVRGVYVGEVGDEAASALVVVDQVVSTNAGERPQPTIYLQLDLVRLSAGWRVDSVINLNLAVLGDLGATAGAGPTSTTTTTAPSG